MTGRGVTYTADQWTFSDGSKLLLDATVKAHLSDIQVTLIDAFKDNGSRVQYWQRTALVDWVSCHQHLLRALQDSGPAGWVYGFDTRTAQ